MDSSQSPKPNSKFEAAPPCACSSASPVPHLLLSQCPTFCESSALHAGCEVQCLSNSELSHMIVHLTHKGGCASNLRSKCSTTVGSWWLELGRQSVVHGMQQGATSPIPNRPAAHQLLSTATNCCQLPPATHQRHQLPPTAADLECVDCLPIVGHASSQPHSVLTLLDGPTQNLYKGQKIQLLNRNQHSCHGETQGYGC